MKIAGSSLLYSRYELEEALQRLSEAGFVRVDLGAMEGWAHLDPSEVVGSVQTTTERVRSASEAADIQPVALNADAGTDNAQREEARIEALLDLAESLHIEVITLQASGNGHSLETEIDRFGRLIDLAAGRPVRVTVETHWGTPLEEPEVAARFLEELPELGLTIDPSHFVIGGYQAADYDMLLEEVDHVHLRQAGEGWERVQQPPEEGKLDLSRFLAALEGENYNRVLTVEYIDSLEGVDPNEAEGSAIAMREALEQLLVRESD